MTRDQMKALLPDGTDDVLQAKYVPTLRDW